jgi:hypothetical protein
LAKTELSRNKENLLLTDHLSRSILAGGWLGTAEPQTANIRGGGRQN